MRLGNGNVEKTDYALPNFKPGYHEVNKPVPVMVYNEKSGTYMGTNIERSGGRKVLSTAGYFAVASVMKGNKIVLYYTTRWQGI